MRLKQFLILWLPVILWAGSIFYFSSLPNLRISQVDITDFILRKSAHFVEFFIFTILLFRALSNSFFKINRKTIILSAVFSFLYVLSDEIHQLFVPGRSGNILDVGIDSLGILVANFLIYKVTNKWNLKL